MFKIAKEPTFTRTVTVCVPIDGGHSNQSMKVTFRVLSTDQLSTLGGNEGQIEDLRRLIVSMDDLVNEADEPVAYSDPIRDQLIAVPYVRLALLQSYIEAVSKAKAGN